ncbi:hypothetical protein FSS13T_21780 [Flavobacterium saliperosum S13]|uniref:Uncharacterized protein n=2 Tax=Flavobacterium saliperosum TaxID=329186 RepID=A0A1G4VRV7_9FLAO|nr:hypothetical protein [Flavobacterium saliperosum]ESU23873.1 hypothetical protein FSS13T_21780 [Flavobacterium saliperosum S13]SCX10194.1 hypothetical protein SAMN02927925_01519 [Flavobacterium saliperosum]
MAKEDFLSKQIAQLGFVLKRMFEKLIGSTSDADFSTAVSQINVALKKELGFDLDTIEGIPKDELVSFLIQNQCFTPENIEIFADILAHIGKSDFNEKALLLYEYVNAKTATFSMERNLKIQNIKKRLL